MYISPTTVFAADKGGLQRKGVQSFHQVVAFHHQNTTLMENPWKIRSLILLTDLTEKSGSSDRRSQINNVGNLFFSSQTSPSAAWNRNLHPKKGVLQGSDQHLAPLAPTEFSRFCRWSWWTNHRVLQVISSTVVPLEILFLGSPANLWHLLQYSLTFWDSEGALVEPWDITSCEDVVQLATWQQRWSAWYPQVPFSFNSKSWSYYHYHHYHCLYVLSLLSWLLLLLLLEKGGT